MTHYDIQRHLEHAMSKAAQAPNAYTFSNHHFPPTMLGLNTLVQNHTKPTHVERNLRPDCGC